jgi:hypothetical protein
MRTPALALTLGSDRAAILHYCRLRPEPDIGGKILMVAPVIAGRTPLVVMFSFDLGRCWRKLPEGLG